MKNKKRKIALVTLAFLLVLLAWKPAVVYHIPISSPQVVKAEIRYQVLDMGIDDAVRNYLEHRNGNVRIFLDDDNIKWLYIDSNDRRKLWPESPFAMKEKNYTIVAEFKVSKALLGGYTVATVADTTHVSGSPLIRK